MLHKKGMAIETIVVMVICLVVAIVVIAMVTGKIKFFSKATGDCGAKGGGCIPETANCDGARVPLPGCSENTVCCIPT